MANKVLKIEIGIVKNCDFFKLLCQKKTNPGITKRYHDTFLVSSPVEDVIKAHRNDKCLKFKVVKCIIITIQFCHNELTHKNYILYNPH